MKRSIYKISELIQRANNKPFSIFLLEDNKFYLQGISSQIKSNFGPNIQLNSFSQSGNFLNSLRKKPEIAVVDYHLDDKSEIDGINLIKELKKNSPNTQIIILTGENKIDTAVKCLSMGVTDYIIKEDKAIDKVANEIREVMRDMLLNIETKSYKNTTTAVKAIVVSIALAIVAAKFLLPDIF